MQQLLRMRIIPIQHKFNSSSLAQVPFPPADKLLSPLVPLLLNLQRVSALLFGSNGGILASLIVGVVDKSRVQIMQKEALALVWGGPGGLRRAVRN